MDDRYTIRPGTLSDVDALVRLRRCMFESMGHRDAKALAASDTATSAYLTQAIPEGAFHSWLAISRSGQAVASGGVVIDQHPPGPNNLSGRVGTIISVVTLPDHRRQGLARQIMCTILDWLASQGVRRAALHATEPGAPLYRELGFVDSNEMLHSLSSGR